jgi:hypothetical protein
MEPLGRLFPLFETTAVSVRDNRSNGRRSACGDAIPLLGAAWWAAGAMRWRGDGGDVVVRSELNGDETRGATQQQGTAREGGAVQRDAGRARAGSTAAEGRDYVRSAVEIRVRKCCCLWGRAWTRFVTSTVAVFGLSLF